MESQLEWKERYNIGVDQIDGQHQRLFRIVNKLRSFSEEEDKVPWACQEGVKYFKNYAAKHFADEEAYMASISYKNLEMHRRLHEDFRFRRLPALERELEETAYSVEAIDHMRGVCTGWLIEHIQAEDQIIGRKESSRWANLLPADEMAAVEQAVTGVLQEQFEQEPQLLSECYSGEAFGEEWFFRFTYGSKEQGKQDMVLIFEKKLLLGMLEKLSDDPQERSMAMLWEIVRSMAKQLEDLEEYSFLEGGAERLGENQLTRDQFRRIQQRQHPRFSLLFDTGEGYFGYCAMTPHPVRSESSVYHKEAAEPVVTGVKHEPSEAVGAEKKTPENGNVSAEDRKEPTKPRAKKNVLVVDDAKLTRQVMKRVLMEDYQVTLAKSGIGAIRCMAVQKPDLILLDYNMPVCDGAQLLEMIRSEEDFADIPVIFLSSTIDKEGVKRVVPLKPQGYLLKSLNPMKIKEKIDRYFDNEK